MHNILVPVDFSAVSHHALDIAAQMATQMKSALSILHVVSLDSKDIKDPFDERVQSKVVEESYEELMKDVVESYLRRKFPAITIDWDIVDRQKRVSRHIADKMENFDLLIMGSNGANQSLSRIVGSTTSNVIDLVRQPVLVIPPAFEYDGRLDDLLFVVDYEDFKFDSLALIKGLFSGSKQPRITCLDINLGNNPLIYDRAEELHEEEPSIDFNVAEDTDEIKAIETMMETRSFDVIALPTKRRTWLQKLFEQSSTERLILSTDLAILAV